MKSIEIFKNEEFGEIRTIEEDGNILFVAIDIAKCLGYSNVSDAIKKHCRWVVKRDIPHPQNKAKTISVNVIPEGDLYRLISHSYLESAEKFESWVFDEVLPSIRKNGAYLTDKKAYDLATNPQSLIGLLEQAAEQLKAKDIRIEEMKPKEIFADAVTASKTTILVRDLAKMIRQNGYDCGEKKLYKWLRSKGYIIKGSTEPTQRAMEMGMFERTVRTITSGTDEPIETTTTKVTGKGQVFIMNKYMKEMERE